YTGRGAGALAFNGHVRQDFDGQLETLSRVGADFHYLYPGLRDVPVTRTWSGPIDMTVAGLPWYDHLRQDGRTLAGVGCRGHGVGARALGGRVIAARLLDRPCELDDLAETLLLIRGGGTCPREPSRDIVGRIVKASVNRKEQAQRKGQK